MTVNAFKNSSFACLLFLLVFAGVTIVKDETIEGSLLSLWGSKVKVSASWTGKNRNSNADKSHYPNHDYYWVGNHWMPPRGVPSYTPLDFLEYFRNRNVLFIGDSTGRRSYLTLYALMMQAISSEDEDADADVGSSSAAGSGVHNNEQKEQQKQNDHKRSHNIRTATLDDRSVIDINRSDNPNRKVNPANKRAVYRESCQLTDRRLYNVTMTDRWTKEWFCRNLPVSASADADAGDRSDTSWSSDHYSPPRSGKFDYRGMNCLQNIVDFFTDETTATNKSTSNDDNDAPIPSYFKDYDLVVVTAGVWDTLKDKECNGGGDGDFLNASSGERNAGLRKRNRNRKNGGRTRKGTTKTTAMARMQPADRVTKTLEALKRRSSPQLQIAFRTVGFVEDHRFDNEHWDMIHSARDFFQELELEQNTKMKTMSNDDDDNKMSRKSYDLHQHRPNMTLVDWGTVVADRSWGNDRIQGDIQPHYGLEARLLFAQQLLHQLLLARGVDETLT